MSERFVSLFSLMTGTEIPTIREGVPSFLGVPVARSRRDLDGADAAIIGVPYDRPPTAGRPANQWAGYREHVRLVDYGDPEILPGDVERSLRKVARKVRDVLEAGCRLVTLGGCVPHANYGVVAAVAPTTPGPVGVISLDAHGDCLDSLHGARGTHELGPGTWQARMWDDCPNIDPARHVEIGMRGPRNVREMLQTYRGKAAHVYPAATVRQRGMAAVCAEALPHAFRGSARTWFSLDIGAIPGWGDEPLGLSSWDVIHAVHEAGRRGVDALSFQFVAPESPGAAAVVSYAAVYLLAGWVLGGTVAPARRTVPPA